MVPTGVHENGGTYLVVIDHSPTISGLTSEVRSEECFVIWSYVANVNS